MLTPKLSRALDDAKRRQGRRLECLVGLGYVHEKSRSTKNVEETATPMSLNVFFDASFAVALPESTLPAFTAAARSPDTAAASCNCEICAWSETLENAFPTSFSSAALLKPELFTPEIELATSSVVAIEISGYLSRCFANRELLSVAFS